MTKQKIVGYETDEDGDCVAILSCSHRQHLRHSPPWQIRSWVTTKEGRTSKLGMSLDCKFCNMPSLPDDVHVYTTTDVFNETNIPIAFSNKHLLKKGKWGRIFVEEGLLLYTLIHTQQAWVLKPGVSGIIAPCSIHTLKARGTVKFYIELLST